MVKKKRNQDLLHLMLLNSEVLIASQTPLAQLSSTVSPVRVVIPSRTTKLFSGQGRCTYLAHVRIMKPDPSICAPKNKGKEGLQNG